MSTNFGHVTHHYSRDANGASKITKVTPIVRVSCQAGVLFLQQGKVIDEGGNVMVDPPGWFYEEVAKVSDQALIESGFKVRPRQADVQAAAAAAAQATIARQAAAEQAKAEPQIPPQEPAFAGKSEVRKPRG